MAQQTDVISTDGSAPGNRNSLPEFKQGRASKSSRSNPYNDMKELVKIAYKNGIAAMEWKEAGLVLVAKRDEDGNVIVKKRHTSA